MRSDISGRNCRIRWVEYSTRQNNQSFKKNHEEKEKKTGGNLKIKGELEIYQPFATYGSDLDPDSNNLKQI